MLRLFRLLEDGNWHTLEEIATKTKAELNQLTKQCEEAYKNGLVEYDAKTAKIRLGHDLMSVLLQLKTQNQKQAKWERKGAGTTILPQGKSLQIQGLHIQNQTENDLKIEFTYNTKPKEIVISKA